MKTTKLTDSDSPPLKECNLNIDIASLRLHKMKESQLPRCLIALSFPAGLELHSHLS